ncbi:uncharacterized protein BDR25DRAFT_342563 [Lindgomyces ingoldianus]|uniref:Uncharacterized protein n=1 Tax=Lindgomyces ingoldianus TaxID=673940 RepID=A0ACB6QWK9_9PLEO|nr:uncharacterized protein BDR25DRAFT_342563 [Lindgomyces ingoldianus]KAF2471270.1 hypothetical protein BDR25DRAFT_342563 [Lindgomyces ingoldianus]
MSLPVRFLPQPGAPPDQHPLPPQTTNFTTPSSPLASPNGNHLPSPTPLASKECSPLSDMSSPISDVPPSPMSTVSSKKRRSQDVDADHDFTPSPIKTKRTKVAPKARFSAAPASNRPTRNRKAPERFADIKEPTKKMAEGVAPKGSKAFEPVYATTNSKSRLATADIYHLFMEAAAWNVLGALDQADLISMLPSTLSNCHLLNRIADGASGVEKPKELELGSTVFRSDVKKWQEDLGEGYLTKRWQEAAEKAMKARFEGAFDTWKEQEAERWWGQKGE